MKQIWNSNICIVFSAALASQIVIAQDWQGHGFPGYNRYYAPYPPYRGYMPPPPPWFGGPRAYYPPMAPYAYGPPAPPTRPQNEENPNSQKPSGMGDQQGISGMSGMDEVQETPSFERQTAFPLGHLHGRYEKTEDGQIYLYPETKKDGR